MKLAGVGRRIAQIIAPVVVALAAMSAVTWFAIYVVDRFANPDGGILPALALITLVGFDAFVVTTTVSYIARFTPRNRARLQLIAVVIAMLLGGSWFFFG